MSRSALPPRRRFMAATALSAVVLAGFTPAAMADAAGPPEVNSTTRTDAPTATGPEEQTDAAADTEAAQALRDEEYWVARGAQGPMTAQDGVSVEAAEATPETHHDSGEPHDHGHEAPEGWQPDPDAPPEPLPFLGIPDEIPEEFASESPAVLVQPSPVDELTLSSTPDSVPSPPSKNLPSTLDAAPGWQYTYSCDPNDKPGMIAFAELVSHHYDREGYTTSRSCDVGSTSQHGDGRAMDWPMNAFNSRDRAIGDAVAHWLTANNGEMARRFGVMSIIWNEKSWYLYDKGGGWRDYNGWSPHTDHLHISFTWDGAMKRTSWWTGRAVTTSDNGACRVYRGAYAPRYDGRNTTECAWNDAGLPSPPYTPYDVTVPCVGRANSYIPSKCWWSSTATFAQQKLGLGLVDGYFGPGTLGALLAWQRGAGVPVTGVLDEASLATLAHWTPSPVERIEGDTRYATAAQVSSRYPRGVPVAYVATGEAYADALAGAARAGYEGGPVLLTRSKNLHGAAKKELERLEPDRIVVLGGRTVVSNTVLNDLKKLTDGSVTRVAGNNRYGTAAKVARTYSRGVDVVYVATGEDYPDALAAAASAGKKEAPVLLTRTHTVPKVTRDALDRLDPDQVYVLGGSSVISRSVLLDLRAISKPVTRIAGADRYATAGEVAEGYAPGLDVVYLATGQDYPDALAGAARAGVTAGPVLLTKKNRLPRETRDELMRLRPDEVVLLGGSGVISADVRRLVGYLGWAPAPGLSPRSATRQRPAGPH